MTFSITQIQKKYLIDSVLLDRKDLIKELMSGHLVRDMWRVSISDEAADDIRDLCSEMLQSVGFGSKYELTTEGKMLNELIDTFYLDG